MDVSGLRIVVLDCPYDTWDQPQTRELFERMVSLKFAGYRNNYAYGVLPVDTSDFVGVHYLVCEERNGTLVPVTAYKSITAERARAHGMTFPGLSLARMARGPEHARVVEAMMKRCEETDRTLSYDGAWTMDPNIRYDKESRALLREVFQALCLLTRWSAKIDETICGGAIRFKTDQMFKAMGSMPLSENGRELPTIEVSSALGEEVRIMTLIEPNAEAKELAQKYQFFWNRRITIAKPQEFAALKKAWKAAA